MDIAAANTAPKSPNRIASIAALSIGTSAIVLDGGISAITLPTVAKAFGISDAASVVIVTAYQLILVSTILPFASLADRLGAHRLYRYGQMVFLTASLLLFLVDNLSGLIIVRVLQALGGAAALSVTAALVRSLYPPDQLGRGLAINSLLISVAAAIAPTIGGFMLTHLPWQANFAVAAPFLALSLTLGHSTVQSGSAQKPLDLKAALLCTFAIGSIVGGIEWAMHGQAYLAGGALIIAGVAAGYTLFAHEKRSTRPVLPVDLLAMPAFARAFSASVLTFMASMIVTIYLPFWLTISHGLSVKQAGLLLTTWPLVMMIVSPVSGIMSDRLRPGLLGSIGTAILVSATIAIANTPTPASLTDLAWRFALGGVGFALFLAPNSRTIVSVAPQSRTASAGSMVSTARLFGQAIGATLVAAIVSRVAPGSNSPFYFAAALGAASFLLCVIQWRSAIGQHEAETSGTRQQELASANQII
jgi:MFS transporter, DHA2 family, multidrug resistance protein